VHWPFFGVSKMKKLLIAASLALTCSSAFAAEPTCAAPGGPIAGPTGSAITGNTCASDSNLTSLCKGGQVVFGPQSVYKMVLAASNGATISVTGTTPYDTALYVEGPDAAPSQGNCESQDACDAVGSNDATGAGGTETVGPTSNAGAGTYYIIVSSTNSATGSSASPPAASAGCGAYSLTVGGSLPVKLSGFSVD